MDKDQDQDSTIGEADALELRVLEGPQAGARAPLSAGHPCVVAAAAQADAADIVLREESARVRVRVWPGVGSARLEVLDGAVTLGEQTLEAGASTDWAMHAPLKVGGSLVAFGFALLDAWPLDAAASPAMHAPEAAPPPAVPARSRPRAHRGAPWLFGVGLAVAVAGAAALGISHVVEPSPPAPQQPALAEALRMSEFGDLRVTRDASGRLELTGHLATLAQRAQLDAWLAQRRLGPAINVVVDEALVRDVAEVFRVNGVAVQARVQGPGHIVAEASERDAGRLARAEEVVRRDVRGLARLGVVNRALPPPPPPPPPVVDDPGKRIASVVPGDPAYLVTADGARYFVGAMLPTGHRITRIAGQHVWLERNGETITLNL